MQAGIELCNKPALALLFGEAVRVKDISILGVMEGAFDSVQSMHKDTNRYDLARLDAVAARRTAHHNSGYTPTFLKRLAQLELPEALRAEIAPLVLLLQSLNEQIKQADLRLRALAEGEEVLARLRTVPGVSVITATSFVSTLDDAARFDGPNRHAPSQRFFCRII
jgi:transposase